MDVSGLTNNLIVLEESSRITEDTPFLMSVSNYEDQLIENFHGQVDSCYPDCSHWDQGLYML